MRKCLLMAVVVAFSFSAVIVSAQSGTNLPVDPVKVHLEYLDAPTVSVSGQKDDSVSTKGKSKWIIINVNFTMPSTNTTRGGDVEWLDNLAIEASLMIPTVYGGSNVVALLTGTQVLWSVPSDGAVHKAKLFVPPVVLSRYYKPKDSAKLDRIYKDLYVQIKIKTKDQRVIGMGFNAHKKIKDADIMKEFAGAERNLGVLRLANHIFPLEKTPWLFADFDKVDMPKGGE